MKFDDICNSILERVFHGTPHDVGDKFDLEKIGTGEGAQVYGWGLYFAERPEVAQDYRNTLGGGDTLLNGKIAHRDGTSSLSLKIDNPEVIKTDAEELAVDAMVRFRNSDDAIRFIRGRTSAFGGPSPETKETAIELLKKRNVEFKPKGNVYEVDIAADKENDFLDWDKPLSEQSRNIFEILKYSGFDVEFGLHKTGQSAYEGEVSIYAVSASKQDASKKASEFFNSIGIKGIKYLDQGSRGSGEGTYNYVVFDPSIIKIVAKNGQFVMNSKKPENVEI
jgi:hypothetical protein